MLILASASPRRRSLLRLIEPRFVTRPAGIPEMPLEGEEPERFAVRLARVKAATIALAVEKRARPGTLVLGADTVVALGKTIFGKPENAADARRMLGSLSGKRHRVITGVAVWRASDGRIFAGRSVTQVVFDRLDADRIEAYVASGEPMDAAGAYQIQGRAAAFIPRIEGSYSNVVGFPLDLVARLLESARAS
jgi:nucleoside triphosphate pyrophosphatase